MLVIKFMMIILGIILLLIMGYQIIMYLRPGIFPPKKVVKDRIVLSGGLGIIFLFIGIIITIFGK
ncbi:hypothetical protein [Lederbergia galactosidilytica]|uniref:Uncharacterized protein n=1 Tax=Lederbergia galactosidilytica TaxID=217031 RepID=A0A0Q9YFS5_9BACI|nr:hypothetical protein [Lederbergia galactosidilytica]KRG16637.1 hypothetical protein ACA30_00445 [Virgibacillus soli]KRG16690.1 hypothetical protein ACA29_04240 [Lederbergia galactosidilytica]MBP1915731.1 putative RDD family membrane protein YckC [Lederbergia galactosidilytica]OAK67778.1 hypothetical protein ABB05_18960 [Lederbergia galactosidilytica]